MTDIRKSDAQLDAEAAGLEDRDLDAAIAAHRILYRVETGILKLHQRDGDSGLGPPFNPIFVAYLDERYGAFPWNRSLLWLRDACYQTHTEHHGRSEWVGSLCHALVTYVIRHETSLDYARLQLGLPDVGRTRRTLDSALMVIERRLEALIDEDRAKQRPARTPVEWMAAPHVHRRLDGLHSEDCHNADCQGAA